MSTAQILRRYLTNSSLLFSSSTLTSTPPSSSSSPSTATAGETTTKTIDPEINPLLDFSRTKVKNQQFSDQNELPLFIAISKNASDKLNEISKNDNNPDLALRVSVESGGCHGFQYNLNLCDVNDFKPTEDDSMFIRSGAKVLIDKTSLEILRDSKIDFVHELIGSQFKVVDSPYTKSSCGCGSSFDFDFDKLEKDSQK
ncbi:unnamed protein product [Ambrosiozyma monospora]|uniref:Unnamed protein product n=1 Tax=Ambrosiozyma monospora TaxID=43982 RepID=A0A9W7DJP3_AMBMO|nr:unnamed protein product [Ambrosiozyma monospora]